MVTTPKGALADTKCLPAAQRKQAKRACIYIYIYICNELIEETVRHKLLIFAIQAKRACVYRYTDIIPLFLLNI